MKNLRTYRNAGKCGPNTPYNYNDVWRITTIILKSFMNFLHIFLNRERQSLDFQHNFEEKLKSVERAEELVQMED